jgi:hypothetical protein
MIRYLKHSEIDPEKWNQAVRNSLSPNVLAEYELLDLLTGNDTWHALVNDDYQAVMPLPTRQKGVLKYVYTPFFLPQMGIFYRQDIRMSVYVSFLEEISKHYVLADVLMNEQNAQDIDELEFPPHFVSYTLSMHLPYNELYSQFHENTNRNIKAAQKHQCRITVQEEKVADIIALFRTNKGSEEAVNFRDDDYTRLRRVSDYLLEHNLLEVYGVRTNDNKLAAGALFVKDGKRRWFWFSGRDNQLSECKPMFLLLDAYIRDHAESDLDLDFNGSSNPNVARLYQGFGSTKRLIPFVRLFKNKLWEIILSKWLSEL